MVMPLIPFEKTLADGSATEGGRRPSLVAAPSAASPELSDRPRRRTFTSAYKLGILRQVDEANPLAAEHAQLQRDYKSVTLRLQRAEAIVEIQKKVALLLGLSMPGDEAS